MIKVTGKYNDAKIFSDVTDELAIQQIENLLNQEYTIGHRIRIMPDYHAGAGCTIGTTMTLYDKVCPNLVGVDLNCGMEVVKFNKSKVNIDLKKLDEVIYNFIPTGFNIRSKPYESNHSYSIKNFFKENKLSCNLDENCINRAILSFGTLGGGNHFIEIDEDNDFYYLIIHSGSRNIGLQIATYYQNKAKEYCKELIPDDLKYIDGNLFDDYIHDIEAMFSYAYYNRVIMAGIIIDKLDLINGIEEQFTTVHNYIDTDNMILRKGAVSAKYGEKLIIPMNMRDGSLICTGKGNVDWNFSAPHGAGRLFSRTEAKNNINIEDFKNSMKDIYTTCVCERTIDESPMAYKPMEEIIDNIKDTVEICEIIKPIYNFKDKNGKR